MGCRAIAAVVLGSALAFCGPRALAEEPQTPANDAPQPTPAKAVFPDEWFFYGNVPQRRALLRRSDGFPAPELKVDRWLVGEPTTMAALRGKIVVLDFWGTWCAPCLAALPHTVELSKQYADRGVEFLAICDGSRGTEKAQSIVDKLGLSCRVAIDKGKSTYSAFLGQWYPFYVIVDRNSIMRASGLTPDALDKAIDLMLEEQPADTEPNAAPASPPAPANSTTPDGDDALHTGWLEGSPAQRLSLAQIQGAPAHQINVVSWLNSEPLDLSALKGKVVLLDFWGTWCAPCLQSVPRVNELRDKYAASGLVVIGVCHSKNASKMPEIAEQYGIEYPIAADTAGATFKAYRVNGTPDYYLIDRAGVVRFADVANEHVEDAITALLAESAPGTPAAAR